MAGNLSVETCGNVFQGERAASANYGIGSDGRIALYVPEDYRSYASSNRSNDNVAITIEVANCGGAPDWPVSDKALEATIKLCVDICKRNDIKELNYTGDSKGNLTRHNMFVATTCPGSYLQNRFSYIAKEVNKELGLTTPTVNKELTTEAKITVKDFQLAAIADGFRLPKYGCDGLWGAECESVAKRAIVKQRMVYIYKNLTKVVQKALGVKVDGLCGKDTRAAIIAYQKKHGLKADGEVGLMTWRSLLNQK